MSHYIKRGLKWGICLGVVLIVVAAINECQTSFGGSNGCDSPIPFVAFIKMVFAILVFCVYIGPSILTGFLGIDIPSSVTGGFLYGALCILIGSVILGIIVGFIIGLIKALISRKTD